MEIPVAACVELRNHCCHALVRSSAAVLVALGTVLPAQATEFATDGDVKVRWDNTVKYSSALRLKNSLAILTSNLNPNFDDGDRNFNRGLISNRVDLLTELDVAFKNDFGFRVSGAAWTDAVYNRATNNRSAITANSTSVAVGQFPDATSRLHGDKAELLDAFVFAQGEVGSIPASIRVGKHTLLYGESLFFGANGIAGGQAPVDAVKLLSVPNSQFKEILRPVGQISGQLQLSNSWTLGGYYQYRWQLTRLPAAGSYFSNADFVGDGGERILFDLNPALNPVVPFFNPKASPWLAFFRGADLNARDSGQGGVQLRLRPEGMDTEFGFYAIQYHDKTPQIYVRPQAGLPNFATGQIGTYQLVYPENIRSYGASFSTVIGTANVAGEMSIRRNTPLVSQIVPVLPGQLADNRDNPLYAVGDSAHVQLSTVVSLSPSAIWQGGTVLAEVAWNTRTRITRNAAALDPNVARDAWGFRMIFEPAYFQVLPGLDITVPVGLGYNPAGRSSVVAVFNGGVNHGGDISIGLSGEYLKMWKFGLNYTHYLGSANVNALPNPVTGLQARTFEQTLKDRDFLSFSAQYTF